jgi:hypothetical protein
VSKCVYMLQATSSIPELTEPKWLLTYLTCEYATDFDQQQR